MVFHVPGPSSRDGGPRRRASLFTADASEKRFTTFPIGSEGCPRQLAILSRQPDHVDPGPQPGRMGTGDLIRSS